MRTLTLLALATCVYAFSSLRRASAERRREDEAIDLAVEGSFPASDPPPWTTGRE